MKIISKYHDFYDFSGMYDTDHTIVWKRVPTWHQTKKPMYSLFRKANNDTKLCWATVGIYPYVYEVPVAVEITRNVNPKMVFLTPEELWNKDKSDQTTLDKIGLKGPETYTFKRNSKELFRGIFSERIKVIEGEFEKKEYQDIFRKLNTPIFVKSDSVVFESKDFETKFENQGCTGLVTDAVFTNFKYDVLRGLRHILNPIETYANIESFLFSVKSEPISNPSNETKIVCAGFDLKTSFRNV